MKLSHIRAVIAVAERGSLRAAARSLGLAQPSITRSIREVEHDLGVALFERRARGVVLTPMGELFLRRATAVQTELRQAREEIEQLKGLTTGHVSVALSTVPHLALFPSVLRGFRQRYPDVFLRVTEGLFRSIEPALAAGGVDFYVGPLTEQPLSKGFAVEPLFDNTRVVFARRGHPLAGATSLRQLAGAGWITTAITLDSGAELGPVFASHGLPPPRVVIEAPSALTTLIAAANSDLLAMIPVQWLSVPGVHRWLQRVPVEEVLPAPTVCIVRREGLPLTPAAEILADLFHRASRQVLEARTAPKP